MGDGGCDPFFKQRNAAKVRSQVGMDYEASRMKTTVLIILFVVLNVAVCVGTWKLYDYCSANFTKAGMIRMHLVNGHHGCRWNALFGSQILQRDMSRTILLR